MERKKRMARERYDENDLVEAAIHRRLDGEDAKCAATGRLETPKMHFQHALLSRIEVLQREIAFLDEVQRTVAMFPVSVQRILEPMIISWLNNSDKR
jgi:hypothetical protein